MGTSKIPNDHHGARKLLTGSGKGPTFRVLGAPVNSSKTSFFDPSTPMRKVADGENKKGKKRENNVVYSGH